MIHRTKYQPGMLAIGDEQGMVEYRTIPGIESNSTRELETWRTRADCSLHTFNAIAIELWQRRHTK